MPIIRKLLLVLLLPSLMVIAGCASMNAVSGNNNSDTQNCQATPPVNDPPAEDNSPRFVIPATGGAPVIAIPLGGSIYLPVTGGAPIDGIPITQ